MPVAAGVGEADILAVPHLVGDEEDLGEFGVQEMAQDVEFERTEPAAEGHVLGGRQLLLVAEDEHGVAVEGVADRPELVLREVVGQIEADDLGAERRMQRTDVDGNGVQGASPPGYDGGEPSTGWRGRRGRPALPLPSCGDDGCEGISEVTDFSRSRTCFSERSMDMPTTKTARQAMAMEMVR